jgi:hypothetical protein
MLMNITLIATKLMFDEKEAFLNTFMKTQKNDEGNKDK